MTRLGSASGGVRAAALATPAAGLGLEVLVLRGTTHGKPVAARWTAPSGHGGALSIGDPDTTPIRPVGPYGAACSTRVAVVAIVFLGVYVVMFVVRFLLLDRMFGRLAARESENRGGEVGP